MMGDPERASLGQAGLVWAPRQVPPPSGFFVPQPPSFRTQGKIGSCMASVSGLTRHLIGSLVTFLTSHCLTHVSDLPLAIHVSDLPLAYTCFCPPIRPLMFLTSHRPTCISDLPLAIHVSDFTPAYTCFCFPISPFTFLTSYWSTCVPDLPLIHLHL